MLRFHSKTWLAAALAVTLSIGPVASVSAARADTPASQTAIDSSASSHSIFKDVSSAHWAASALKRWKDAAIVLGYPDGTMRPDRPVTRAEFDTLLSRIFGFEFHSGGGDPAKPLTRSETAEALNALFRLDPPAAGTGAERFTDTAGLSPQAKEAIAALAAGAYLQGYPDGAFRPDATLTRAQIATVLDRLVGALVQDDGSGLPADIRGNVVVNRPDAALRDTKIDGRLYITAGVGSGDVRLTDITVTGTTYIDGGGEHSIVATDADLQEIAVNKKDDKIRLRLEGKTKTGTIRLQSGATVEQNADGTNGYPDVIVAPGHPVSLQGHYGQVLSQAGGSGSASAEPGELVISGTVEELKLAGPTKVRLEAGAVVKKLVATTNAGASTIEGPGTIGTISNESGSLTRDGAAVPAGESNGSGAGVSSGGGNSGGGSSNPWTLVWSDEFNDDTIDASKWTYDIGNGSGGWGNNELEYYTSRPENVKEENGHLVITARKENYEGFGYTSTRIKTKGLFSKKYGKFEIRAKAPAGKGYWPAIWMLPEDNAYGTWAASGELDIMESWGSKPNTVAGTIHYGEEWPGNTYNGESYVLPNDSTIEDFHTYSIEWEPGEIRWYVDGHLYSTKNDWYSKSLNQPANNTYPAPFDQPFHLLMNLAVGGHFDGDPDETTPFPKTMEIDYVRVYDLTGRPYRDPVPPAMAKEPLPADARQPLEDGNYVYNGGFDQDDPDVPNLDNAPNTDYWRLFQGEGGVGSVSVETIGERNFAKISIGSGGWQPYSVQLLNDVSIAKGRYYKLSFDAKSSDDRSMTIKVTGGESRGFAAYSPSTTLALGSALDHYELSFQMKQDTDIAARTEFNVGLDAKPVWIGNVRLEEIDGIAIDEDGSKTPLNGDGNHVYNGSFDQGDATRMTYWHTAVSGGAAATAQVSESERKLALRITAAGNGQPDSVKLLQKGMALIADADYALAFDAKASAARSISVALVSKDGTTVYDTKAVTLGTTEAAQSATFKMTGVSDDEAQLVFLLGGATGGVKLDNVKLIRTSAYYPPETVFYPLANGSFADGLSPWETAVDSGGALTASIDGGEAKLNVTSQGSNPWSSMFIQNKLKLIGGLTYTLDFDARASAARKMELDLENASYFRYLDKTVDVGTETAHYSFDFVMSATDTVSLKFFLGLIEGTTALGSAHDVFLSHVDLKVKDAPVARPPRLFADTTDNHVGRPIGLTFDAASGSEWQSGITAVKIGGVAADSGSYSIADGVITLDAGLFPRADSYTVTIESGGYAFASVSQDVLANDGNLIRNGDFAAGTNNWLLWSDQNSTWQVQDGHATIAIANKGAAYWSTQFYQENVAVEAGKSYRLTFKAGSTVDRPIYLEMNQTSQAVTKFNLTATDAEYAVEFNAQASGSLKLNLCVGDVANGDATTPAGAHQLRFDDLKLVEIAPVPDPTGHALANGTFDTNTEGWSLYTNDGSDATISSVDGEFKIAFTNYDGWFVYSTQVYQDHLQLDAGKTYTLSFKAKATEAKSIIVSVENATDYNVKYLGATTIALTSDMTTYSYEFAMGGSGDSNGKLLIQLGSDNAEGPHFQNQSVIIDDVTLTETTV